MAKSGHRSSRPPPASRSAPVSSKLSPVAAIQEEAQQAAKELVVDDFVDTYLRERPKTRNPYEPLRVAAPPAPPAPPTAPSAPSGLTSPLRADEESGIRVAVPYPGRVEVRRPTVEVEAIAVGGPAGEVVALEAELAEREERIESLEQELKRLRDSVTDEAAGKPPRADAAAPPAAAPEVAAQPPAPPRVAVPAAPAPSAAASAAWPPAPAPPAAAPSSAAPLAAAPPVAEPPRNAVSSLDAPVELPPTTTRRSPLRRALGVVLLVGAVGALAMGVTRLAADAPAPAVDPGPAGPVSAPPPAEERRAAELATGRADAPPPPTPTAEAIEPPAAPPSASSEAATPVAPAAPPEPEEAPDLLSFQGYLTVASSTDAEVVVQGQPVGRTNQRLLTRCGPRNVRLRDGATWITEGEHVRIVCMKHTSIRMDPAGGPR